MPTEDESVGGKCEFQEDTVREMERKAVSGSSRLTLFLVSCWTLLFLPTWISWFSLALGSDLHSHVVIIPLVSIFLLISDRHKYEWASSPSRGIGLALLISAIGTAGAGFFLSLNQVDLIALQVFAHLLGVFGIIFFRIGKTFVVSSAFPLGFLFFMIPLPGFLEVAIEHGLMTASAWLSELVFGLGGIPVHRQGQVLELPGITLEVAQECSGIRSTLVLVVTSVLAAYLFLTTSIRRVVLVAVVLPLGVLRNAVRIYVIGWLCTTQGPEMIDSWIHRKGGPVFFAISLVPLLLVAWALKKNESKNTPS